VQAPRTFPLPRYGPSNRPRDSQRSRLYRAENELDRGQHFPTIHALRAHVDYITGHEWWRYYFPKITAVAVKDGRGRRRAAAHVSLDAPAIMMPRWSRSELVTLHELAHIVTPATAPAHGPRFARLYLCLVDAYMGRKAGQDLLRAYAKHRIEYER